MESSTEPARLGNVYATMAFAISEVMAKQPVARALLIDAAGTITLLDPDHDGYAAQIQKRGFIGFASASTTTERLERRIRDAHRNVLSP